MARAGSRAAGAEAASGPVSIDGGRQGLPLTTPALVATCLNTGGGFRSPKSREVHPLLNDGSRVSHVKVRGPGLPVCV